MPIDFLSARNNANTRVSDLVRGYSHGDEISKTMANIGSARDSFLSSTGLDPRAFISKIPALQRKTEGLAARSKIDSTRNKFNLIYQNVVDKATQAGMDRQSAEAYARKVAELNTSQEFQAGEAEKSRTHSRDINEMLDKYGAATAGMESSYKPPIDYTSALLRVLLGTGTAAVTSNVLNNRLKKNTSLPSSSPITGYGAQIQDALNRQDVRGYTTDYGTRGKVSYP